MPVVFESNTSTISSKFGTDVHTVYYDITTERCIRSVLANRPADREHPFMVVDLSSVLEKVVEWRKYMPRVEPFYAVKCNNDPVILRALNQSGVNFDCASEEEIRQVLENGTEPSRIIFAHPCKQRSHLAFARDNGVRMMTFDNEPELQKVAAVYPKAELLLRVMTDDSNAQCRLSCKFGAALEDCPSLLAAAKRLGVRVTGVAFHVGSGNGDVNAFTDALARARRVFDMAKDYGFDLTTLDIGGGFPGTNHAHLGALTFPEIAEAMAPKIDELFAPEVRVIAEPGRFFAHSCGTLVANVIGKRKVNRSVELPEGYDPLDPAGDCAKDANPDFLIYVNDGVYGSFNNTIYDHANHLVPKVLNPPSLNARTYSCTIFGPTCDGLDTISRNARIPEVNLSDWIYYEEMGAYTVSAGGRFNGFQPPERHYFIRAPEVVDDDSV